MNAVLLLRLLGAHFLADFALQTNVVSQGKKTKGRKAIGFLLWHSLMHAGVSYLFLAQWTNWVVPLVVFLSHFAMDYVKSHRMREGFRSFAIDQFVHVLTLVLLWAILFTDSTAWEDQVAGIWNDHYLWKVLVAYILVLHPSSLLLSLFIKKWTPTENREDSLPNAGRWIGFLERLLILTFILTEHMEGIGFLLAAKSVFRFGDLSKAKDIKTTEYVLIGTLASFTIAIIIGLLTVYL